MTAGRLALFLVAVAAACSSAKVPEEPRGSSRNYTFERFAPGALPSSFASDAGAWRIQEADGARSGRKVLAQTQPAGAGAVALAWVRDDPMRDVRLRVHVRASATIGFGAVWHLADARRYLACGVHDGVFRVEAVVDGKVREIGSRPVALEAGRWYALDVEQIGTRLRCGLDATSLVEAVDDSGLSSGAAGVCTFGDATAEFDDLTIIGA
ncbi:MAG TPA: hypothetical protein VKE69_03405 [Planctomycetota bacterium]|nr:hypothetical protein [Planctomycetota bacterium]